MSAAQSASRLAHEIFLAGFVAGLPPESVAWATHRLAQNVEDLHLLSGEVLYRQGERSDAHYFVLRGEIEIAAEGVPSWVLGERSLVGTIDLTMGRLRSRTATATRDTHLLRMPASDWLDMLEDNVDLLLNAVEGIAGGIHQIRVGLTGHPSLGEPTPGAPTHTTNDDPGLVERVQLLRRVPLFAGGGMQSLVDLATHATIVDFAAEEVIATLGRPAASMFVILHGAVAAADTTSARAEQLFEPGELVLGARAATSKDLGVDLRATTATRALQIVREDFFDVIEEHFTLGVSALRALASERERLTNFSVAARRDRR